VIRRETPIPGAYVLEPERKADERGFFARTWCGEEFASLGLEPRLAQCSVSYNLRAGTIRGMHFQREPHAEVKVVRCTAGSIYDVLLDLRPDSPGYLSWFSAELTAANRLSLYVPAGVAHGFQTLTEGSEVFYQISEPYHADLAGGVRWDDPTFGIRWPLPDPVLSARDRDFPDFRP
jgi:dTDP-4-dehydrorhamnose 3,5-epimerase